jgi:hypothetical protein
VAFTVISSLSELSAVGGSLDVPDNLEGSSKKKKKQRPGLPSLYLSQSLDLSSIPIHRSLCDFVFSVEILLRGNETGHSFFPRLWGFAGRNKMAVDCLPSLAMCGILREQFLHLFYGFFSSQFLVFQNVFITVRISRVYLRRFS